MYMHKDSPKWIQIYHHKHNMYVRLAFGHVDAETFIISNIMNHWTRNIANILNIYNKFDNHILINIEISTTLIDCK